MSFSASVSELVASSQSQLVQSAPSWPRVPLIEIVQILNGAPWKSAFFNERDGVPLIRIRDVTTGRTNTLYSGPIDDKFWVEPGDLLVGMDGDFNVRVWDSCRGLLNQRVCKLVTNENFLLIGYLSLIIPGYLKLINDETHSITVKHLSSRTIGEIPLPLPPLPEQRRIVAKLDSLRARSSRARQELDRIPALIERYKQAILSREYTIDGAPKVQLSDLLSDGPTNGYSPRSSPDGNGTLSLKLTATTRGVLDLSEKAIKRLDETIPHDSRLWLKSGDLLVQRANSIEYLGASAIFDGPEGTFIYPDLMMRIRIECPNIREYVWRFLNSSEARSFFRANATGTAGNMPKINAKVLKSLTLPLPSENEIRAINRRISLATTWLDKIKTGHSRASHLLPKLDQAILAKAFRGELVPQDPSDEPASVLLARIRKERAAQPTKSRRGQ